MIKRSLVISLYVVCIIVVEFLIVTSQYHSYQIRREQYLSKKTNELQIAYTVIINGYSKLSRTIFDEVINKTDVLDILQGSYNANEPARNEARKMLYHRLLTSYNNLNRNSSIFIHFQLPDCTSFLRMYDPQFFGDNLGTVRSTIKVANEKKIITQGFEIGSIYSGYRFIYPLVHNNLHIGSVEIGISNNAIKDEMEKVFKSDFDFIISRSVAEKTIPAEKINKMVQTNLNMEYLFETLPSSLQNIIVQGIDKELFLKGTKISDIISDKLARNLAFSVTADLMNKEYIISFIPIFNYEGRNIAYLVSYTNDNIIKEYYSDLLEKILLFSIIFIAMIIFIRYASHTIGIIKKNRDFLQSVTDNMSEGLIVLNKNLKVISINHTAEKILDLNLHEAKGRVFTNIVECRDENGVVLLHEDWPIFANVNFGVAYKSRNEFYAVNKQQIPIPLELSVSPHYQKTDLVGYLVICKIRSST